MNPDGRSRLMEKLGAVMPRKEPPMNATNLMMIEHHPIRLHAEAFAHFIGDELPSDARELRAMLWVFGEMLCGDMEQRLNWAMRTTCDAIAGTPPKSFEISIPKEKSPHPEG